MNQLDILECRIYTMLESYFNQHLDSASVADHTSNVRQLAALAIKHGSRYLAIDAEAAREKWNALVDDHFESDDLHLEYREDVYYAVLRLVRSFGRIKHRVDLAQLGAATEIEKLFA